MSSIEQIAGVKIPSAHSSFASGQSSSRLILRRFLLLFLPVALICIGGVVLLIQSDIDSELEKIRSSEVTTINVAVKEGISSIRHELQLITRDLALLAVEDNFIDLISQGRQANYKYVLAEWLNFAGVKEIYDQIRWIDRNGRERIRINYSREWPIVIPEDQLQNKGKRYYFADTFKLNRGEFFISPLDLNIENGKIEQPLKPMIRIGTPVFDRAGKKQGIVILNYLAETMLRAFSQIMGKSNSRSWLVNRDGYWLKGPSAGLEWGFMYQRNEASLANRYPDAWRGILAAEQGQFENERGLWTFDTIHPLIEGQKTSTGTSEAFAPSRSALESREYFWKVILFYPRTEYYATMLERGIKLISAVTIVLILFFFGSWFLARASIRRNNAEDEVRHINAELEHAVQKRTHDLGERVKELTGLYSLAQILSGSDSSVKGILAAAAEVMPPAWHYPEITCARITIGTLEASTENFEETAWGQASNVVVNGKIIGQIEVFYLEEAPELDEGPFLKEERALINQMAERIGEHIEHKQAEEQLRRSQKMDTVGQMVSGITHDFNNVLGIIMGNLEILRDKTGGELGKRVDEAMKGAKRGAVLTRKLLAFSRRDNVGTKVISIAKVIEGMGDLLGKSLTPAIETKINIADDLWPVMVDPDEFEDALVNLALNARDSMPDGGRLVIEAENKKLDEEFVASETDLVTGDYVLVSVGDTGTGMTPEVMEKALEPFFSTKEKGHGTGLGLSMVYGFVKRSSGYIKIYSEPGEGTTVRIYLPRSMEGVEALADSVEIDELPRGTETVLVVDDETQLVDVSVHHLEQLGYRTLSANSGEEALEVLAGSEQVDVLFSDIVMHGGMDGYDLAKSALKQHPDLKVLLTTGFTTKHEDVLVKRLSPSSRLIKKPYTKSELARTIRQVLDA